MFCPKFENTTTTTSTTTTTEASDVGFWEEPSNIAWVTMAIILGLLLLGLLAYLLYRVCYKKGL